MATKKFLWGVLVMVLAFGIAAVGCGDELSSDSDVSSSDGDDYIAGEREVNPFVGTWKYNSRPLVTTFIFKADLTVTHVAVPSFGLRKSVSVSGTYTYSGNKAIIDVGILVSATINGNSLTIGSETYTKQ
jgi:hypothetical protein